MAPLRILIIDDSPDDRAEVRRMLLTGSDRHYTFTNAATGKEGVEIALSENTPDFIILDFSLPDMDALEALQLLRNGADLPPCPVIVLTGSTEAGRELIHAGAQDYLGKGWASPPVVTRSLENALERYSLEKNRNQAMHSLRVSEEFNRTIIESTPDCVVVMNTEGRLLTANQLASEFLNISSMSELRETYWWSLLPEEVQETARQAFATAYQGGVANFEHMDISGASDVRWWDVQVSGVSDLDGKTDRIIAVSRDVTERKLAKDILEETSNRLTLGLKASGVALIHVDHRKNLYHLTPEAADLLGRGTSPLILSKKDFDGAVHEEDLAAWEKSGRDPKDVIVSEFRISWPNGETRWLRAHEQVFFENHAEASRSTLAIVDVTTRKEAETELLESARRKDDFLSMLAHELRNPLAPLLTGAELIERNAANTKFVSEFGSMMRRQVGHMSRLIEDLIDLSRLNHAKIKLQLTPVNLSQIIQQAIETIRPLIDQKKHDLTISNPEEDVIFIADHHRLIQVLSNLLSNAARYTEVGGKIALHASVSAENHLLIEVSDNGRGISAEDQKSIFKMFDQGTQKHSEGLGIGLTLVKSLVEMHGGTISLKSEGLGKGSRFLIDLPLADRSENVSETPVSPAPENQQWRILIAEDGRATADVLGMFFKMEGLSCQVAYDGAEAVEKAATFHPHIACLDLGMPILDGYETAKKLRQMFPGIHLVALSGWGREEDRVRTASAGFDEHLTKPVSPADLRKLLARVLPSGS